MTSDTDTGYDWAWGIAGPSALSLPVGMASKAYINKLLIPAAGAPKTLAERRLLRQLVADIEAGKHTFNNEATQLAYGKKNVDLSGKSKGFRIGGMPYFPSTNESGNAIRQESSLSNLLRSKLGLKPKINPLGSSFNPLTGEINLARGQRGPAILAHELGHAQGGKALMGANIGGKLAIPLLMSGGLISNNEDTGRNWALGGSAAGAGLLASELDASRRGYNMLRGLGAGRKGALKAFLGIPTYLGMASLPWLGHTAKKLTGSYNDNSEQTKIAMSTHPYLRCYAASLLKAATFQDMGRKADSSMKNLNQFTVNPLSAGGSALVGGTAGAAAGGLVGLLRAALDSEDDDLGSTARKALQGGFIGGAGGAALGMGGAKLKRDQILDKIEAKRAKSPLASSPSHNAENIRKFSDQVLRRIEVPVIPAIRRMTGGDPEEFSRAVGDTNSRAAMMQLAAAIVGKKLSEGSKI